MASEINGLPVAVHDLPHCPLLCLTSIFIPLSTVCQPQLAAADARLLGRPPASSAGEGCSGGAARQVSAPGPMTPFWAALLSLAHSCDAPGTHVSISEASVSVRRHWETIRWCSAAASTQMAVAAPATIWLAASLFPSSSSSPSSSTCRISFWWLLEQEKQKNRAAAERMSSKLLCYKHTKLVTQKDLALTSQFNAHLLLRDAD